MKKLFIGLFLIPYISLAQTKADYAIYSQYLRTFQTEKNVDKIYFIINESPDYLKKYDTTVLKGMVRDFRSDLQTIIINDFTLKKYFKNTNRTEKNWKRFHDHYPKPAFLIELSEIVNDGHRAIFYYADRCGGLCGNGCLVLFYKDRLEWKFFQTLNIWSS